MSKLSLRTTISALGLGLVFILSGAELSQAVNCSAKKLQSLQQRLETRISRRGASLER
jgi:hypothetical protein